jgi:hypothetical protein
MGLESTSDRSCDQGRIPHRYEVDEHHSVGERVDDTGRRLHGESALADAARTGQRQQTYLRITQSFLELGQLLESTEQRRRLQRQVLSGLQRRMEPRHIRQNGGLADHNTFLSGWLARPL